SMGAGQEFDSDRCPDLNKDVYLQDIHCVSSLCKAYFRELPNPLLTYQLYDKFADAVAIQMEEGRLVKIKEVLKELPSPHYRTLEFLMRHLVHMASYSSQTNMHARNLAIVWAPNLLRSKDIEASGFNGTAAFMEVRVQSIVVEFILNHVEQLFRDAPLCGRMQEEPWRECPGKAVVTGAGTMSYNLPAMLNQGDGPPQIRPYHTIIELNDHKRKGSLKVKKWRSIFNLGRSSNDSKRKLAKAEEKDDKSTKMSLRPAKSMDSLSSVPDTNDGSPSSREESFLESDEYPDGKFQGEEGQQTFESEGEASAKSEPTTPKAGRASLVGGAPQGRSPMTARNRAEKCAGVHISVPFSVTVPFHITSNISLSRLTRGLECPALSYSPLDKEALERSSKELEAEEGLGAKTPLPKEDHNRLSMEVQDSFSFLDNQDTWQDCGTEGDQPEKSLLEETTSDFAGDMLEGFQGMDDDMESRFMNLEFSVEPPPEYLSIEECMNEEQYYMATSCSDTEELSKETDSEEVFLSAYDDLSPLAPDLEMLRQLGAEHGLREAELALCAQSHEANRCAPEEVRAQESQGGLAPPMLETKHLPLESGPLKPVHLPVLPEPDTLAGVRPDGSAPMRVTSSTVRVQQVKSVPIVPPKPQFARMPPTVKMTMHLGEASTSPRLPSRMALAKERHLAQAPVRRMQTYCVGDGREMHGIPKVEKPLPFPRPALKPVGQRSLRPLSCTGALLSPDAPAMGMHPPLPDTACEPRLVPGQEPLPFAQEPAARSRLSMPRLGQRPSDMEEAVGPLPQLRRSLAFEIRDCGGSEL
uniref:Rho GTPase activating protein 30 n=1 Tax=Gopherus evgoodei TaxID=1825980 RepID=A0A8C4WM34_9SAUR